MTSNRKSPKRQPGTRATRASAQLTSGVHRGDARHPTPTDEQILAELQRFLRGRTVWPSYRDFQRAGLRTLRDTITHRGGAQPWAEQLGIRCVEPRPGYPPIWTEERIREELGDYLTGRQDWPSRQEFERDGQKLLRDAINRTGGPDRWAGEFGVRRPNRRSGIRRGWTPEAIEADLRKLIGGGSAWPSRSEFYAAGLSAMLSSIYVHEGPAYWAIRMGVEPRTGAARRRESSWSENRIRKELKEFCAGREVWPTEREFIIAGRRALYAAASRKGGIPYWASELGLPRRPARA